MRESWLRPKLSVPKRYVAPGGTKRVRIESLLGAAARIMGTKAAASKMMAARTRPVWNERCRSRRRSVSHRANEWRISVGFETIAPRLATSSATVEPHARIEPGIGDVHDDVDAHQHQRHEEQAALDHRIVAIEDRRGQELADARDREHRHRHHRARA